MFSEEFIRGDIAVGEFGSIKQVAEIESGVNSPAVLSFYFIVAKPRTQ